MDAQQTAIPLILLGWVFTGLLLLLLITCLIAGRGSLPLNPFFGVRIPTVMRDARTWRAGHAAGVLPAAVTFVVALLCSGIGLAIPGFYWGAIGVFVVGVVWVFIRASSAARTVESA